jgi:hypothetical protein
VGERFCLTNHSRYLSVTNYYAEYIVLAVDLLRSKRHERPVVRAAL